jgi:hypothetical protein
MEQIVTFTFIILVLLEATGLQLDIQKSYYVGYLTALGSHKAVFKERGN